MREIIYTCKVCGQELDYPECRIVDDEGTEEHKFYPCQTCLSEAGEKGISAAEMNIKGTQE